MIRRKVGFSAGLYVHLMHGAVDSDVLSDKSSQFNDSLELLIVSKDCQCLKVPQKIL